uniref:Peptidase S1 domain-containing protein n=1 Tax=Panagrolaimus sp. JU765 TaxID=591449 RepID=A0AC34R5B4_9BILA
MLAVIFLALLAVSSAEDRIHNGKVAPPDLNNVVFIVSSTGGACTGTIVSEHYILTAAHCLPPSTEFELVYTRDLFRDSKWMTPSYQADQWIKHPDYKKTRTGDDIALIRIATPMTIPPVPLPANYSHPENDWLRSAGYGRTNYTIINATKYDVTDSATALMETYLQGAVGKDCFNSSFFKDSPHLNVICVGKSNSTLLKGDSAAVTDVSHYCPWIEETTGGEVKCQTFKPTPIVPPF